MIKGKVNKAIIRLGSLTIILAWFETILQERKTS